LACELNEIGVIKVAW